jgi:Coenzyme PQQ synthesis protein D (PqqD)
MAINKEIIPLRSKDVVTRNDSGGVLLFQVRTDEMHFISDSAFALFALCDGSRTVGDIVELLAEAQPEMASGEARERVGQFIESLADRHVVELMA